MVSYQEPASGSAAVFGALADPTRRAILDTLRAGGRPIAYIADGFEMTRPAVAKHLHVLRDAGLIRVRPGRDGRERICELNAAPLRQLDDWLNRYRVFWARNLKGLKTFVESED
jgi:DNA-binding transcriptional ArsR family regulator